MKRNIILILFVGISVFRAFGQELTFENFVHPHVTYYSVPFWSLNDKLEPDEIKRQLKAFIDVSYKPYAQRYKDKFGKVAHGIFTDEPQFTSNRDGIQNKGHLMYSPFGFLEPPVVLVRE